MKYLLTIFVALATLIAAEDVKLAWDPNPEPDVTYRLSYGTEAGVRPTVLDAGSNTEITVANLNAGIPYFFAVQAATPAGILSAPSLEITYTIPNPSPKGWVIKYVSDEQADGYAAELAIDENPNTFWHTTWREGQPQKPGPHEIQIDMRAEKMLSGFTHLARQDEWEGSNIKGFDFYVSLDGISWGTPVASGEFAQGKHLSTVRFPAQIARYFRLVSKYSQDNTGTTSVAEVSVIETAFALPATPTNVRVVK